MGRIGTHWITDRWPNQADATPGGFVEIPGDDQDSTLYEQWNRINQVGQPWRRVQPDATAQNRAFRVIGKNPESPTPRRFVSINRTYHDLGQTVDATADDGTAWRLLLSQGQWIQLPPLPAREAD